MAAETANEAATAASDGTDTAAGTAGDSVEALAASAEMTVAELRGLLTVDGFDFDRAIDVVDASDLNAGVQTATRTALEGARDNPALLEGVLGQLRDRLGLSEQ